jgi:hypothetical protein
LSRRYYEHERDEDHRDEEYHADHFRPSRRQEKEPSKVGPTYNCETGKKPHGDLNDVPRNCYGHSETKKSKRCGSSIHQVVINIFIISSSKMPAAWL